MTGLALKITLPKILVVRQLLFERMVVAILDHWTSHDLSESDRIER